LDLSSGSPPEIQSLWEILKCNTNLTQNDFRICLYLLEAFFIEHLDWFEFPFQKRFSNLNAVLAHRSTSTSST